MASYKIGDRVRIVGITEQPTTARNGMEGVVTDVSLGRTNYRGNPRPYGVFANGEHWIFDGAQLEPIQPTPTAQEICEMSAPPDWTIPLPAFVGVGE